MKKLPPWVIPDKFPAIYDIESMTVLEMTARLYAIVQELIESYKDFSGNVNDNVNNWSEEWEKDFNSFKTEIEQKLQNFMDLVELMLKSGDYNTLKNKLDDILKQLENSGLLIILEGEERVLEVGVDVMPNQTINFKYEASGGYNISWWKKVDSSLMHGTTRKIGVMADGMVEDSYTISSNTTKIIVSGIHCILISPVRESILELKNMIENLDLNSGYNPLPDITEEDNGKVLMAENGKWVKANAPTGLPDVTTADNEKVLAVVNGAWALKELNIPTYEDGNEVLY